MKIELGNGKNKKTFRVTLKQASQMFHAVEETGILETFGSLVTLDGNNPEQLIQIFKKIPSAFDLARKILIFATQDEVFVDNLDADEALLEAFSVMKEALNPILYLVKPDGLETLKKKLNHANAGKQKNGKITKPSESNLLASPVIEA